MVNVSGWETLLRDSFFQHMEGSLNPDDAQRLLTIIGDKLYMQGISFSADESGLIIPERHIRKEAIGFKAEMAKRVLRELYEAPKGTALYSEEDTGWIHRFRTETDFRDYVFQLLDFLIERVQSLLPDIRQIPPLGDRAKATAQDNADDLNAETKKAEETIRAATEAGKAADAAKEAVKRAIETADGIMPNMLTTLGVFIAIVIAVVACYLSVLLSHYAQDAKTIDMSMVLLMGHILLNIIFLLLYLISKMSGHSLACYCLAGNTIDCQECDSMLRKQCSLRHKLWLRYPYAVVMNGIFIAAYCVLGLWYLVGHYFGDIIDRMLKANRTYAAVVVGAIIVLIIAIGIFALQFFLRSPTRKAEKAQEKERKAKEKEEKAQARKRKTENESKNVRKLRSKQREQDARIVSLEEKVETLTKKLEQYAQEEKDALVE